MFALLPILIAPSISFQGGGPADLVRAMARQGIKPVAIFANPDTRIKSFLDVKRELITPSNLADLTSCIAQGTTLGISSRDLPVGFLMQERASEYASQFERHATLAAKGGKLFVDTSVSNWISVNELVQLHLTKPISCHWVYRQAFVAVTGGTFDEKTLLETISDALGATWHDEAGKYRMDFNAASHRARAIGTYRNPKWSLPEGEYPGRKQLYAQAAEASTDETWEKAFRTMGSSAIQGGLDPFGAVANEGFRGLESLADNARRSKQIESYRLLTTIFSRIDRTRPPRLQIQSDGRHHIDFPLNDGKGWTGL